jgi:hypothetical protein
MTERDGEASGRVTTRVTRRRDDARRRDVPAAGAAWARREASGTEGPAPERHALLGLQRRYGNRYVQRVVAMATSPEHAGAVPGEVERALEGARGGGHALDRQVQAQMGDALGADFSNVRVHANAEADGLNRTLQARAFTLGQDIYFRQGEYAPGSSTGRELLAHELTHVVQQNAGAVQPKTQDDGPAAGPGWQTKLSVSQPGDPYEQEADRVASAVMHQEQRGGLRLPETASVQRQVPEEDEDTMQAKYRDETTPRPIEERT